MGESLPEVAPSVFFNRLTRRSPGSELLPQVGLDGMIALRDLLPMTVPELAEAEGDDALLTFPSVSSWRGFLLTPTGEPDTLSVPLPEPFEKVTEVELV